METMTKGTPPVCRAEGSIKRHIDTDTKWLSITSATRKSEPSASSKASKNQLSSFWLHLLHYTLFYERSSNTIRKNSEFLDDGVAKKQREGYADIIAQISP